MTVRVKFFAHFRGLFGSMEREVVLPSGARVADLLAALCLTPEQRDQVFDGQALKPHVVVLKNGSPIQSMAGLATDLDDGDTLAVFPLLGGG